MANTDRAVGFVAAEGQPTQLREYDMGASETTSDGDVLYMGSDGYITGTRVGGYIAGIQVGDIIDGITRASNASSSAVEGEDKVLINDDPDLIMIAQINTGAQTDRYTTGSSATAFDIDISTTGAHFIDSSATAQDEIKVLTAANEPKGSVSAFGANQKVYCRFNRLKHVQGTLA